MSAVGPALRAIMSARARVRAARPPRLLNEALLSVSVYEGSVRGLPNESFTETAHSIEVINYFACAQTALSLLVFVERKTSKKCSLRSTNFLLGKQRQGREGSGAQHTLDGHSEPGFTMYAAN